MTRNPKTARLLRMTAAREKSLRLTQADRMFLHDLAKVRIISNDLAAEHHYAHLKGGADRPLGRLVASGLLREKILRIPAQGMLRTYEFASHEVARAWGGALPVTGAKRTDLHELITSRIYFSVGRPQDFRLAADFSKADIAMCGSCRPDAFYTDDAGELVAVESDSGQYNRRQILMKQHLWSSFGLRRQVWGQPLFAAAPLQPGECIDVYRY